MTIEVPGSVLTYLAKLDADLAPLPDYLSPPVTLQSGEAGPTIAQRKGVLAEVEIWRFARPNLFERLSRWGIYWSETGSATTKDGIRILSPDADKVDAEVVQHWVTRARTVRHPVLRARYADVAWEVGRYLRKRGREVNDPSLAAIQVSGAIARCAIDSYVESVSERLTDDWMQAWQYLDRAIELAKTINDPELVAKGRAAAMECREAVRAVDPSVGQTWRFYEIVAKHFASDLAGEEVAQIMRDLQAELEVASDISQPDTFNPHAAMEIAERLDRWAKMSGDSTAGRQALQVAGAAFEAAAGVAGGLVAVAWLEDLLPRYRAIGDSVAAARVEEAIRQRADDARAEMKSYSVAAQIPQVELDRFAVQVCGGSLEEALRNVVLAALMRFDSMVDGVRKSLEDAPVFAAMTLSLGGPEGFTEAKVGGIEEDEEGRAIFYAAQMMSMQSGIVGLLFDRILEKYSPTVVQLADYIHSCPFFGTERRPLLERALRAWLDRDALVAAHLLVPQLEAALRALCRNEGGSVMTPDSQHGGFRVIGLGAVLSDPCLAAAMPRDVLFHLKTLLTDPRGLSARNHIAHGMSLPESLGMWLCNWLVHAVLMISLFRPVSSPAPSSEASATG